MRFSTIYKDVPADRYVDITLNVYIFDLKSIRDFLWKKSDQTVPNQKSQNTTKTRPGEKKNAIYW